MIGFPFPIVGVLTITGSFHTSIPKLDTNWPTLPDLNLMQKIPGSFTVHTTVPFQNMDALYFLYTDTDKNAIKYNLTTKSHSIVKKSQSVYEVPFVRSRTKIGKFYWILGHSHGFRC